MTAPHDPLVIVGGDRPHVPGSTRYECDRCNRTVWLAPVTVLVLVLHAQAIVWCGRCAADEVQRARAAPFN
jgi:ribosomal protein S27AE